MRANLSKSNNELIKMRRKKRIIKRSIIFAILLIAVAVTLCLKLTYFNVTSVNIIGNSIISTEEITNNAKVNIGTNIFYMNLKQIETNTLSNPYIESVVIKRKLPSTILLKVKEREAAFYGKGDKRYYIIDKGGIILEGRENIDNMKLTKLLGFDFDKSKIGVVVPGVDSRRAELIKMIAELISLNSSKIPIDAFDLSSMSDIKMYSGNMVVKLGDNDNLKQKINKSIIIIKDNNLISEKGYVDVSFEGNPVFYIEKQEDKE